MIDIYLVTIVPPVAAAVMNLKAQNSQNHGENAEPTPAKSWMKTAATNGPRRPYLKIRKKTHPKINRFTPSTDWINWFSNYYLSANVPNIMFPIKIPNMKTVWLKLAICFRSHTKFHVIWSVSVKMLRSKSYDVHSAEHLSVTFDWVHLKSMFGAMNMMLIWCQATGNLSKNIIAQTRKCHRPNWPIACWIGSDFAESTGLSFVPLLCAVSPFASMSIAIMGNCLPLVNLFYYKTIVFRKSFQLFLSRQIKLKINFKMVIIYDWLAQSYMLHKRPFILLFTIYTQFQNNLSIVQLHLVNLGRIRTSIICDLILNYFQLTQTMWPVEWI